MNHIILIGFKHTGKSVIGKKLAEKLEKTHIDLDNALEEKHSKECCNGLSCRQIVQKHGIECFRNLEKEVLREVEKKNTPHVISVGGGTPLDEENQSILIQNKIVHITAPRGIVYERIMTNGRPAFFPEDANPFDSFTSIWDEREPIYKELAHITVENSGSIEDAAKSIQEKL